jgi:hypothetical protein
LPPRMRILSIFDPFSWTGRSVERPRLYMRHRFLRQA